MKINNPALHPENQALVDEFYQKLKRFQQQTSDPWRNKWQYE
jgi:hypothetical protein